MSSWHLSRAHCGSSLKPWRHRKSRRPRDQQGNGAPGRAEGQKAEYQIFAGTPKMLISLHSRYSRGAGNCQVLVHFSSPDMIHLSILERIGLAGPGHDHDHRAQHMQHPEGPHLRRRRSEISILRRVLTQIYQYKLSVAVVKTR
jgi:hypothetical protein